MNVIAFWMRIAEELRKWLRPRATPLPAPEPEPAAQVSEPVAVVPEPVAVEVVSAEQKTERRRLRRRSLDQRISELLEFMSASTLTATPPRHRVAITEFDAMEPLDEAFDTRKQKTEDGIYPMNVSPRELKTWDVSWLVFGGAEESWEYVKSPTRYQLGRFRSVNLRVMRGRRIKSPYAGQLSHALLREDGKFISCRINVVWSLAGWERPSPHGSVQRIPLDARDGVELSVESDAASRIRDHAGLGLGISATRVGYWHVVLGYDNLPSISFLTDPEGARSVFRLRDLPEGRQRRAALRHWVTEHWRRTSRTEDETKVRAYLRGALEFHWNGLHGRIVPSELDRAKNLEQIFRPQPQEIELETEAS